MAKIKGSKESVEERNEGLMSSVDEDIQPFLRLIADNTKNDKHDRDAKNEAILALFKEGFEAASPDGTKKIGSKVIQQILWRVMSKIKFLNYTVHKTGGDESVERLVTEGIGTVAERGGLVSCFRDKGGVFQNSFLKGNGFLFFGKGENDENPVSFRVLRNEDVYADNFSYGIRGVRPARKMCVVFAYDKEEAYEIWPILKENDVIGRIPGSYQGDDSDLDRANQDILEVAWGYNLNTKTHVIFAGSQAFELEKYKDKEYPFFKNNKAYIPVFQFMCQPSADSFYDYGIGDMVFDLAVITRKLMNMEIGHLEENVYPITLINAPQSRVDELVEKMAMATQARELGGKPFVAMEFDPNGGQSSVATQSLVTQNLFNEWSAVWDRLYKEISRLGINLDDVDRGSGYTRGQVIAEEESSNAFIKQMQEYNASETQELMECVIDSIKEFVSKKNKTPLNLTTRIKLPDGYFKKIDTDITMGMLKAELDSGNWFVKVDSRTGAMTSDLMRMIKVETQLGKTQPGTPEYAELYRESAELNDLDISITPPAAAPQGAGNPAAGSGGNEVTPAPSETQRVLPPPVSGLAQPV
jgi:hypothetical protein